MSLPSTAPSWLRRALSEQNYVYTIFDTLKDREETRQLAGSTGQNRKDYSSRSSSKHLGSWSAKLAEVFKPGSANNRGETVGDNEEDAKHAQALEERYRTSVGAHPAHSGHNRYANIIPYDRTRVRVSAPLSTISTSAGSSTGNDTGISATSKQDRDWAQESDYLNANWVRELHGGQWYAAAQAPLRETAHAFLSMFLAPDARPPAELAPEFHPNQNAPNSNGNRVENNGVHMRTAVQLTVASEGGMTKAHPYFHASQVGRAFIVTPPPGSTAPPLEVRLEREEKLSHARCVKSVLRVVPCRTRKRGGLASTGEREHEKVEELGPPVHLTHLLFTHWPDYGVPKGKDKAALVEFARVVADVNRRPAPHGSDSSLDTDTLDSSSSPPPPIAINCSAGIGRTGTFIALSSLLRSHGLLSSSYPPSTSADFPALSPSALGALPEWEGDVPVRADPVAQEVDALREQRPMMVQSPAQFMLIYELLAAAFIEADIRKTKTS